MWHQLQRTVSLLTVSLSTVTVLVGLTLLLPCLFSPPPALAAIRQFEEASGQVLYQSRETLWDGHRHSWQAIAFQRSQPNEGFHVYLRLVAFPGTADIDRSQPLVLTNSLGEILKAADTSSQIFTDASSAQPNVSQYDLQPILNQLRAEMSWHLQIPSNQGEPVTLFVPSVVVEEWHTIADYD